MTFGESSDPVYGTVAHELWVVFGFPPHTSISAPPLAGAITFESTDVISQQVSISIGKAIHLMKYLSDGSSSRDIDFVVVLPTVYVKSMPALKTAFKPPSAPKLMPTESAILNSTP